jgi:hypothetical protein
MGMKDRAKETASKVDRKLAHKELALLMETRINIEELSPKITSHQDYDELMNIINNATDANNNVALLEEKIYKLGESGLQLANNILKAIK